jgi:hypothetical protein
MVSTLAMTDALAKLMIAKGILTERLLARTAAYRVGEHRD